MQQQHATMEQLIDFGRGGGGGEGVYSPGRRDYSMMVQHPQKQVKQVADSSMRRLAGLKTHQKKVIV